MSHPSANKKTKINPWGEDHVEKISDSVPTTIGWNQQLKGLVNPANMLDQMFVGKTPESPLTQSHERKIAKPEHLVFSRAKTEDERKMQQEQEILMSQLKQQVTRLEKSENAFTKEIAKIKVAQQTKETGIYFVRFLEWMIATVKQLTMKIDDGRMWMQAFSENKKKKQGYWNKYKKHGTSFGLSNERSTATQTG